jgi:hypothetical protein
VGFGKERVMAIELTREQLQSTPIRVTDPETKQDYVLMRAEVYDRIKLLIEDEDTQLMYRGLADLDPED